MASLLVSACLFHTSAASFPPPTEQSKSALLAGEILNPDPPDHAIKLIFIHHSTGGNWIADPSGNSLGGDLGRALMQNNYFLSATNYGWGPNSIGSSTDIPDWLEWFRGVNTPTYMKALYSESNKNIGGFGNWPRLPTDPGGENEIVLFKSCFPNSALDGNPDDPPSPAGWLTVGHAKYVYNEILGYFATQPDKLFIVITAPPLSAGNTTTHQAANARAFNQWLVSDWLSENNYTMQNVAIFDFYNVLTGPDNHHRYYNGQIEHIFTAGTNTLYYPSAPGDDHPSHAGNIKATDEFIELLNIFYHRWQEDLNSSPRLGGCVIFPENNIWNAPVDNLPVHARSDQWINSIGRSTGFHMDFGSGTWDGGPIGIPYNLADDATPTYMLDFYYPDESDARPYPIPNAPNIEWGSDHHILVVNTSTCFLYEIYDASFSGGSWSGGSGAIWDLGSNTLRPIEWTSADAAGLPILPGLVRYDEIVSGAINHAIRFTASDTNSFIWPARHLTSGSPGAVTSVPPMGARFRLKASFDISGYPTGMQVILQSMKTFGIILADNGSDWYISGAPDERWDNDMLHLLDDITGDDFEAVDTYTLMVDADSGEARSLSAPDAFGKSAPTNGSAGQPLDLTLAWNPSTFALLYEYCFDTSNDNTCSSAWTSAGTSTSANLSGLAASTTYYWQARAQNLLGMTYANGGTWWSFSVGALPPPAPAKVQASDGAFTDKVMASWDVISSARFYEIYRATSAAGVKTLLGIRSFPQYNDTTASPGFTYFYWVKACNGSNCSDFSTCDIGWRKPLPPASVQASDGIYLDKVVLTWKSVTGATSYQVYRAITATGARIMLGSATGKIFNDTTAAPNLVYTYWVKTCNGTNCSDSSLPDTGRRLARR